MTATNNEMKKTAQLFDVIIIGAGLIGTAGACLFARQGLKVALIEARSLHERDADHERVSAISLATGNLLNALQVWHAIPPNQISPYREMKVWDCNSSAKISFAAADIGEPCLGHIINNHAMLAAMLEKLRQNYSVTILHNTEIVGIDDGAGTPLRVTLSGVNCSGENLSGENLSGVNSSGETVQTRLLVAADGSRSRVRELCGIPTRHKDFNQDAIVSTLSTSGAHRATAWQCFMEGAVAMLPLADGRCSLVWSCEHARADELMALDDAQFCARLQELFFDALGEISGCEIRRRFALSHHHAERYLADSVALVGDAAHLTHPLAGLGANIGFMDVAALAEVVERARADGKDIGQHTVLRRYQRWRKGDNELVLAMMAGLKNIFASDDASAKAVRSAGMNLADSFVPLKTILAKYATGLYGDIPALCRRA